MTRGGRDLLSNRIDDGLSFSLTAVARIQHALRMDKLDEAVALFRASR